MKYLLLLSCLFLETELFSQSITSILHNKKSKVDTSITEILVITTSYSETQNYQIKNRHVYLKGLEQFREDFDEQSNVVNSKLSYYYDKDNNLETTTFENWSKMGYLIKRNKYVYDETGLVKILIYNGETFSSYCLIVNNEKKLPVALLNFYANGAFIGREKAGYDYAKNQVTIGITNNDNVIVYSSTYAIDYQKNKQNIKLNEYGDEIYYEMNMSYESKGLSQFIIEYDYDKRNNWIKKKEFVLEGQKRKKYQTVKRTISYSN